MDPFAHHNRYWMRKQKEKQSKKVIIGFSVSILLALIALGYAVAGKEGSAVFYGVHGLGIALLTAKFGGHR